MGNRIYFRDFLDAKENNVVLEHLTLEEMQEIMEAWYNPADWVKGGLKGIGQAARGIYNMPNQVRAGFHGIDTNKYQPGTPQFQQQLLMKQHGLDPSLFTSRGGKVDQAALDKEIAKKKFAAMSPEQQQQYYQTKADTQQQRAQAQTGLTKAKTQYRQAQNQYQQQMSPGKFVDSIEQVLSRQSNGGMLSAPVKGALTALRNALDQQSQQTP